MIKKLFGNKEETAMTFGAERLTPMREDFPDENFLNHGRIIVDIRDEESIEDLGYYPNSVFIPFDDNFVDEVKKLNKPVYVLCEKGVDSYEATLKLREAGIDAQNLNGGLYYIREVINIKPTLKS
jgi:rhodanese-related sulfurtransferase